MSTRRDADVPSGYYRGLFSGSLLKKSRARGLFGVKNSWKTRNFKLEGQIMSYYDENGVEKGRWNTQGAQTSKLRSDEAKDGSEYGFVVKFQMIKNETIDQKEETAFFIAACPESRSKWMSHINASSISEKWSVSNAIVQKKTGFEISRALLMRKDVDKADTMLHMFAHSLDKGRLTKQLDAQIHEIEKAKANVEATYTDKAEKQNALAALTASAEKIRRDKSVHVIQANVRIFLSKMRINRANLSSNSARVLTRAIRKFCSYRKLLRRIREARAYRTLAKVLLPFLTLQKEIKRVKSTPQLFCVEIIKADHLISADGISGGVFAYTMSAVDQSGAFRGSSETDIKNGYGLCSQGLHQSSFRPYSHDPVWENEEDDEDERYKEKCYVQATADSYLVVTLMSKDSLKKQESYLGQAIVSLSDYERDLYHAMTGEERRTFNIFNCVSSYSKQGSKTIEVRDAELRRYVAPVEDVDGVSHFSLNSALQVRRVTGTVSFRFRRVSPLRCHMGMMEKVSNSKVSLLKRAVGNVMWKSRFFVLLEDRLYYSKDPKNPSNANLAHQVDLKTVTNMDVRRNSSPMEIELTSKVTVSAPESRWTIRIIDGLASLETWVRRIYYNCDQLSDPEIEYLFSREYYAKQAALLKGLKERERARMAAKWGSRTAGVQKKEGEEEEEKEEAGEEKLSENHDEVNSAGRLFSFKKRRESRRGSTRQKV